jgi:hypothetical protein
MARFNQKEQTGHRKSFIDDCTRKAWGAACHAAWMEKSLNELIAHYQALQAEDKGLEAEAKANAEGFDGHTVENRHKRAEMQKKRTDIGNQMKLVAKNTQEGAVAMQRLLDSVDQNLLLADHAKDWSWIEKEEPKPLTPGHDVYVLQKDWVDRKAGETLTREEVGDGKIYKDLIAKGVIVEN